MNSYASSSNQGRKRKSEKKIKHKKEKKIKVSNNQEITAIQILEENLDLKYQKYIAEEIVKICHDNGMIIFGNYVCEYMCGRTFNFDKCNIDIWGGDTFGNSINYFTKKLRSTGFRVDRKQIYDNNHDTDAYFDIYHCKIGMMNDDFFIGKKIDITVNFIENVFEYEPPFKDLDFTSNSWIWDHHGIRLSRRTGTDIDILTARDIKLREMELLNESQNKITTYFPFDQEGRLLHMGVRDIFCRMVRIEQIVKMLEQGWKISNINQLITVTPNDGDICCICQNIISTKGLKMTCCVSMYHYECFINYSKSELNDRTFIQCIQHCSELHL